MGIATAIIALSIAFWIAVGPERKGFNFEDVPVIGAELPKNPTDLESQHEAPSTPSEDEKKSFDEEKTGNVQTLNK